MCNNYTFNKDVLARVLTIFAQVVAQSYGWKDKTRKYNFIVVIIKLVIPLNAYVLIF